MAGLARIFVLAFLSIYALLAIPLRSYTAPLIIMAAIPFAFLGAIWGHWLMGFDLSVVSVFGLVALAGVVVNDSLILFTTMRANRSDGTALEQSLLMAGRARFRPVLMTSTTTFAGLTPLLLEQSVQAQFVIPMALSIAFGGLFSGLVALLLVPAAIWILADVQALFSGREPPRPQANPGEGEDETRQPDSLTAAVGRTANARLGRVER